MWTMPALPSTPPPYNEAVMSVTPNWENLLRPYDWVQNITADRYKFVTPDDTATIEQAQPVSAFARFIALMTNIYHDRKVLLPGVPCETILRVLRQYNRIGYWIVEEDPARFNRLADCDDMEIGRPVEHPRFIYDLETMWHQAFTDWVQEYDPEQSQVSAVIVNGPLCTAAADMVDAWNYLAMGGQMFAFLPHNDLFRNDEEGEALRQWAGERELTYGVPAKGMLEPTSAKIVCLFGEKRDP